MEEHWVPYLLHKRVPLKGSSVQIPPAGHSAPCKSGHRSQHPALLVTQCCLYQASQRAVAYAATQIAQPGDTVHLLCVLLVCSPHPAVRTHVKNYPPIWHVSCRCLSLKPVILLLPLSNMQDTTLADDDFARQTWVRSITGTGHGGAARIIIMSRKYCRDKFLCWLCILLESRELH